MDENICLQTSFFFFFTAGPWVILNPTGGPLVETQLEARGSLLEFDATKEKKRVLASLSRSLSTIRRCSNEDAATKMVLDAAMKMKQRVVRGAGVAAAMVAIEMVLESD